jgi:hypothetical protein
MSDHHENVRIVAFVGLAGSHVEDIITHLTGIGYPKVTREDIVSQIHHLSGAGQHRIVTSDIDSLDLFKTMKHEFPGELTVVGVVATRDIRHKRLSHITANEPDDWNEAQTNLATVIGMADTYMLDNKDEQSAIQSVTKLLSELGF